jgi:hypothetical protein
LISEVRKESASRSILFTVLLIFFSSQFSAAPRQKAREFAERIGRLRECMQYPVYVIQFSIVMPFFLVG